MIRQHWHVGCASIQLEQRPVAARVFDQKIVLFRDEAGVARALLDRCCHRGLPLSLGRVESGRMECGFHGWQYEGDGRCVRVPSQPPERAIPRGHCVRSFPCTEKDGYVWVWVGDGPAAPAGLAPSFAALANGGWVQGSRTVRCHYLRALEIVFDADHLFFAHPGHFATLLSKRFGMTERRMELRATETGCLVTGPVGDGDPRGKDGAGVGEGEIEMEFRLPGTIRFGGARSGDYMVFHVTPIDERTCRMDWTISQFAPQAGSSVKWAEGDELLDQDQRILEAIQATYDAEGEHFEHSVEADLPTLTLRKIVRMAESGEWDGRQLPFAKRRTFVAMAASQGGAG